MENGHRTAGDASSRFDSHRALAGIGAEGQRKIETGSILVIGAGGLGCPALQYLAASGVGTIGICDADTVSESNLNRQILFRPSDIGKNKATTAAEVLSQIAPSTRIEPVARAFTLKDAHLLSRFDVVLDCTDRFVSRFEISTACAHTNRPLVLAAAEGWRGLLGVFRPAQGCCYACATSESVGESGSCSERGVLSSVTGILGAWQAAEALRWLVQQSSPLLGKLLHVDIEKNQTRTLEVPRFADCPFHSTSSAQRDFEIEFIQESELEMFRREGIQIYDLRDEESPDSEIAGSIRWPYEKWMAGDTPTFSKQAPIVVFCERSQRSWIVAHTLRKKGILSRVLKRNRS